MSEWSETMIARELALHTFERKHLVIVPNCMWTGDECDLLVVTQNLRIIDVEIKISRADLKADPKKSKWWDQTVRWQTKGPSQQLLWPRQVWKHYYAMPKEVWKPEFREILSPASGVLLLTKEGSVVTARCERRSTPNLAAYKVTPESAIALARLASLRYWDLVAACQINRERGYA